MGWSDGQWLASERSGLGQYLAPVRCLSLPHCLKKHLPSYGQHNWPLHTGGPAEDPLSLASQLPSLPSAASLPRVSRARRIPRESRPPAVKGGRGGSAHVRSPRRPRSQPRARARSARPAPAPPPSRWAPQVSARPRLAQTPHSPRAGRAPNPDPARRWGGRARAPARRARPSSPPPHPAPRRAPRRRCGPASTFSSSRKSRHFSSLPSLPSPPPQAPAIGPSRARPGPPRAGDRCAARSAARVCIP